jgi:hypothetical protein
MSGKHPGNGDEQTQEKPTTPSGDALDDTGQDNRRQKDESETPRDD